MSGGNYLQEKFYGEDAIFRGSIFLGGNCIRTGINHAASVFTDFRIVNQIIEQNTFEVVLLKTNTVYQGISRNIFNKINLKLNSETTIVELDLSFFGSTQAT